MTHRIEFKRSAAKALKKIPIADTKRLRDEIDSFVNELSDPEKTKMKGNNPFYRVRIGDYMIIYEIHQESSKIVILKIGHRKDLYPKL